MLKNRKWLLFMGGLIFLNPPMNPVFSLGLLAQKLTVSPPRISEQIIPYEIEGKTAEELRQQMNQKGPIDSHEKRRYDAITRWRFQYEYRYNYTANQCKITAAKVDIFITFTMPKWRNYNQASPELVERWNRYIRALQLHENGHKSHGIDAGIEMGKALSQIPSYVTCPLLKKAIQDRSEKIVKKYTQMDINYDKITGHGRTQSAIFP